MKFVVKDHEQGGTCLQGYVTTTRKYLESVLGNPNYIIEYEPGEKVTCEWAIHFEDGTVATVYDWGRNKPRPPRLTETCEWHIGGYGPQACEYVSSLLHIPVTVES